VPVRTACSPSETTLCPVDEAALDPSFAAYRTRLLAALENRSEAMLLPLVADDIRTSFGDGGGIRDFQQQWTPSSGESRLWLELSEIVRLGGTFRGEGTDRMFWAPHVYSRWPDSIDAFEHVAAIRDGVPVREQADERSRVVATLNWSIVRILDTPSGEPRPWRRVRAPGGAEGWVRTGDVRSPIGYRAGFRKADGEWKMAALVAGD
jgi:hypothetical protein